jgi:plastocyanin
MCDHARRYDMHGGKRTSGAFALILAMLTMAAACTHRLGVPRTIPIDVGATSLAPEEVHARVGDIVEFRNRDVAPHTVTERTGRWSVVVEPKTKDPVVMTDAGTFEYFREDQSSVTGRIIVGPAIGP